uniref:Uncharacterized protein n=1 Tax=Timema cristinae TaxID=61476 RepID=A0A7R9DCV4_TIMCR|nr:unnamed protein product [Timema cristinae]
MAPLNTLCSSVSASSSSSGNNVSISNPADSTQFVVVLPSFLFNQHLTNDWVPEPLDTSYELFLPLYKVPAVCHSTYQFTPQLFPISSSHVVPFPYPSLISICHPPYGKVIGQGHVVANLRIIDYPPSFNHGHRPDVALCDVDVAIHSMFAPLVPPGEPVVNALSKQRACLENVVRACLGLQPEHSMLLEHKLANPLTFEPQQPAWAQ